MVDVVRKTTKVFPRSLRRTSLRGLLLFILLWALGVGWFANVKQRASRQQVIVERLELVLAVVDYDYEIDEEGALTYREAPGPRWMQRLLGENCFATVVSVWFAPGSTAKNGDLEALCHLPHLTRLELRNTQIDEGGLDHLREAPQLESLDLSSLPITDRGLVPLAALQDLKWLALDNTLVSDRGLQSLKRLERLEGLRLAGTGVSDAGLVHLKNFPNLSYLCLSDTTISDTGLRHLKALTGLRYIALDGTRVTGAAVRELERSLPSCQVFHKPD